MNLMKDILLFKIFYFKKIVMKHDWKYWYCYALYLIDFDTIWLCVFLSNWNITYDFWKEFDSRKSELLTWLCGGPRQWRLICWYLIWPEGLCCKQIHDILAISKDFIIRWYATCYKMTCSTPQDNMQYYDSTIGIMWS